MSHRYLTDPNLSSSIHASHSSNNPAIHLNEFGPRRVTDPVELRKLVLDYLCHQCFVDTATSFARESISSDNESVIDNINQPVGTTSTPTLTSKSSRNTLPLKDTVVERTVRFETDGDGDAEMGDMHNVPGTLGTSPSNTVQTAGNSEGAFLSLANDTCNLSGNQFPKNDKNESHSNPSSSTDRVEFYPDWTAQDVETTRIRLDIKEHIIRGKIKEAIKLIEAHFPAVLGNSLTTKSSSNPSSGNSGSNSQNSKNSKGPRFKSNRVSFTSRPLSGPLSTSSPSHSSFKPSNMISGSSNRSQSNLQQNINSTNGSYLATHQASSSYMAYDQNNQTPHAIFGSLNPAHIALNLQIQFFVEFVRSISQNQVHTNLNGFDHDSGENHTRSLSMSGVTENPQHSNGKTQENATRKSQSGSSPHSHSVGASNGATNDLSNSVGGLSDDTSTTSSSISTRTTSLALCLPHCRALHDFVHQLTEPVERAIFAKELENVAGLLAYVDPWDSPVRKYLDQNRRDSLAERVNAAILVHLGRSPTSVLQLVAQQTTFTWTMLSDACETFPCPTPEDKNKSKRCTHFNLHDFVNLHDFGTGDSNCNA